MEKTEQKQDKDFKYFVRVATTDLDGNKKIVRALTKIKGVGRNFAHVVCNLSGIDARKLAGSLTDAEVETLSNILKGPGAAGVPTHMFNRRRDFETGEDKHVIVGALQYVKDNDIKRLMKIKAIRGIRHSKGLPVRGQRTKSNFRRHKGKVIGLKKKKK